MRRKWLLFMLAAMTAIMLAACAHRTTKRTIHLVTLEKLKKVAEFRIGMEAGYPPFNWTQQDDANGAVKIDGNAEYAGGYDVQMAKKVAEGLEKN